MLNSTKFYGESLRKIEQIGIASVIIGWGPKHDKYMR